MMRAKWIIGVVLAFGLCAAALADVSLTGTTVTAVPVDNNALAIDTTTDGGRSDLALFLSAKATGETVSVYGFGSCGIYGNYVEDIWYAISQ